LAKNLKEIAIFGAGGFGLEVSMLVEQMNAVSHEWELIGFFDDGEPKGKIINGYPVLGGIDKLNQWNSDLLLILALREPKTKKSILTRDYTQMIYNYAFNLLNI